MKGPFTPEGEFWILAANGTAYWPDNPHEANIDIETIAQSLSQKVRFGGHGRPFYSVAQHVTLVQAIVRDEGIEQGWKPSLILQARRYAHLHDAHEAWLADLPSPLKKQPAIRDWWEGLEFLWDSEIFKKFNIMSTPKIRKIVKFADLVAMKMEGERIMPTPPAEWEWPGHGANEEKVKEAAERLYSIEEFQRIWTWEEAEQRFLQTWEDLQAQVEPQEETDGDGTG